jgi:hypothetical protein
LNVRSLNFSLFADYFQFYLQDEAASGDLSQSWDEEATERLLAVAPGTIGVGTVRNNSVPVLLEIHDQEPNDDLRAWDHVVECSLDVSSGRVVIAGCTDYFPDAARIVVAPGHYRARVSYGALDTLSESEDGLNGDDRYRVQLWLAAPMAPRVVKQRSR